MSRIRKDLLDRLQTKLNVGNAAIYNKIKKIAAELSLPRDLAAIVLAGRVGLSMQKYATREQLTSLRGVSPGGGEPTPAAAPRAPPVRTRKPARVSKNKENTIFVVHGRDQALTGSMYDFLRAIGLKPQEWGHAINAAIRKKRGGNPIVNEAVTTIMETAQAILVILSPDDEVKLRPHFVSKDERQTEGKSQFQARPNVIFETGIALGTFPDKTLVVRVGKVKAFTDMDGMHILAVSNSSQSRHDLVNRLRAMGCKPDTIGNQWLSTGSFEPARPKK